MYEHRTAYRHTNGEPEGFIGIGGTKAKAKADAITQIKTKLDIINSDRDHDGLEPLVFMKANLVEILSSLTREEIDKVQADWRSGVRY